MSKFLVIYFGNQYIEEADSFEAVLDQYWKYPDGVTLIAKLPEEEEDRG